MHEASSNALTHSDNSQYGSEPWYRHVCALGGVGNVLMMMTANLVGFAIGTDGMRYLWGQLLGNWAGE